MKHKIHNHRSEYAAFASNQNPTRVQTKGQILANAPGAFAFSSWQMSSARAWSVDMYCTQLASTAGAPSAASPKQLLAHTSVTNTRTSRLRRQHFLSWHQMQSQQQNKAKAKHCHGRELTLRSPRRIRLTLTKIISQLPGNRLSQSQIQLRVEVLGTMTCIIELG